MRPISPFIVALALAIAAAQAVRDSLEVEAPPSGGVMFDKPPYATNCARCPKHSSFGEPERSRNYASTRCFWCADYLCSACAVKPFSTNVDACGPCGERVDKSIDKSGCLHGPEYFERQRWQDAYGSASFRGYLP